MNLDDSAPKWPPANTSDELHVRELATWIDRHRFTYTRPALEASAASAGYTREEFEATWAHRGGVRRPANTMLEARTVAS